MRTLWEAISARDLSEPSARHRLKWRAFWLSIFVPGLGQLRVGRWTGAAYLAAAIGLGSATGWPTSWRAAGGAALALASAERARRFVEYGGKTRPIGTGAILARVRTMKVGGRGLDVRVELEVPRPAEEVWSRMADLRRFVAIDPFHARVIVPGPGLEVGADLVLEHRVLGVRFHRFGRLLRWREGESYAISDLSAKGARGFFPHVFAFDVVPTGPGRCRLSLKVRGRWNSRVVPKWAGAAWVGLIGREHARLLRAELA